MGAVTDPTLSLPWAIIHRAAAPKLFYFPIAPQRARITFPARGAVHQTMTSNYLDDFCGKNSVLAHVELRGTFGYAAKAGGAIGVATPGSITLRQLETIYATYNDLDRQVKRDLHAVQEYLCLPRQHFWRIWIKEFGMDASAQDPLLWYYRLTFLRLEDYLAGGGGGGGGIAGAAAAAASGITGAIGDTLTGLLGTTPTAVPEVGGGGFTGATDTGAGFTGIG